MNGTAREDIAMNDTDTPRPGTHPLHVGYLVAGLVFLGLAGTGALVEADLVRLPELRWLFPAMLVAAGLAGLVAAALKARRHRHDRPEPYERYEEDTYEGDQ